jgi:hypothetical protein
MESRKKKKRRHESRSRITRKEKGSLGDGRVSDVMV